MANISDYLSQIQKLTQQNLSILKTLNDSFFTKKTHLEVTIGEGDTTTEYIIPSFPALENKINSVEENLKNLIYAPKTGEATFYTSNGTRSIVMKGYENAPSSISISNDNGFGYEINSTLLKDLLSPNTFVKLDISGLPEDICSVYVRKVIINNEDILRLISGDNTISSWDSLYSILVNYKENVDYELYDIPYKLPVRTAKARGEYIIKSIDEDVINANLDEQITVTLYNDLKYLTNDGVIEHYIKVGDKMVTNDDAAMLEVIEVDLDNRKLTLKILNGDYVNLSAASYDINQMNEEEYLQSIETIYGESSNSILKIYKEVERDKYFKVPVTSGSISYVFVAAYNDRLNIRSTWSNCLIVDPNNITTNIDGVTKTLTEYSNDNVVNIGEVLMDMAASMGQSVTNLPQNKFDAMTTYKPDPSDLKLEVVRINSHLDNTTTIQSIRDLYSQKQSYIAQKSDIQTQIDEINNILSSIEFTDTTGMRSLYETQLADLINSRNEYDNNIVKISDNINRLANDSVAPIENAKYRIRGYYDWEAELSDSTVGEFFNHLLGIRVFYRYKNMNASELSTAMSIDDKYIFSDWNELPTLRRNKRVTSAGVHKFQYDEFKANENVPKFNQIDIPITQSESVEIKLQCIWDFGYPFAEVTSDWSATTLITFPEAYTHDVNILDIIGENNNDIETNRFNNILKREGMVDHTSDKIMDQDVTFYHKPESIASGFYTAERRIVPLRDKLKELNDKIIELSDTINSTALSTVQCSLIVEGVEYDVQSYNNNIIYLPSYEHSEQAEVGKGEDRSMVVNALLKLKNPTSNHIIKLYSMFPGINDTPLNNLDIKQYKYNIGDYAEHDDHQYDRTNSNLFGVWMTWPGSLNNGKLTRVAGVQTTNQWITFRIKELGTGAYLYDKENPGSSTNLNHSINPIDYESNKSRPNDFIIAYPFVDNANSLNISNMGNRGVSNIIISPNDELCVPIVIKYAFDSKTPKDYLDAPMSFDLRTSLYEDPTNYSITFRAPYKEDSKQLLSQARSINPSSSGNVLYNPKIS